jgi:hypothetical protein
VPPLTGVCPKKGAWAKKKPASVAAGVLSFESEIKSGQHPARIYRAVVVMPD